MNGKATNKFNHKIEHPFQEAEWFTLDNFTWSIPQPKPPIIMRGWQETAFHRYTSSDKRHKILNAPTGAGKSHMMNCLIAKELSDNPEMRAIVAVPKLIISNGFNSEEKILKYPDGSEIAIQINSENNICLTKKDIKSKAIYAFLNKKSHTDINSRILVCSHTSLSKFYEDYGNKGKVSIFKNVSLWIDEAHHVTTEYVDEFGKLPENRLGGLAQYFLDKSLKHNLKVNYVTATFIRGDHREIINPKHLSLFERYNLDISDYFLGCKYLESFSYSWIGENVHWLKSVERLLKEGIKKTIIFIPSKYSQGKSEEKEKDVRKIYGLLGKVINNETEDYLNGIVKIKAKDGKILTILNMVNLKQKASTRLALYLRNPETAKDVDLIINQNVMMEGVDWAWANRVILTNIYNSLPSLLQRIGRAFRDHESKLNTTVEIHNIICGYDLSNTDDNRERINRYMDSACQSMLVEMVVKPIKFKSLTTGKDISSEEVRNYIRDNKGSDGYSEEAIKIVNNTWISNADNSKSTIENIKMLKPQIINNLIKNNLASDRDQADKICDFILAHNFNKSMEALPKRNKLPNKNLLEIPISQLDPISYHYFQMTGKYDGKVLSEMRDLLRKATMSFPTAFDDIINYIKKHNDFPRPNSSDKYERTLSNVLIRESKILINRQDDIKLPELYDQEYPGFSKKMGKIFDGNFILASIFSQSKDFYKNWLKENKKVRK